MMMMSPYILEKGFKVEEKNQNCWHYTILPYYTILTFYSYIEWFRMVTANGFIGWINGKIYQTFSITEKKKYHQNI